MPAAVSPAGRLQAYLHRSIPLSAAMQVRVTHCEQGVVELTAPLSPNVNHRHTMFGGSISALALLAGWGAFHLALEASAVNAEIVIRHNTIDYVAPAAGDVTAHCAAVSDEERARFARTFRRLGKARMPLVVTLRCGSTVVARFHGDYAALAG
ncbi:thioesterase domain-containing protein [Horticoccus luteus]|uniref:Thioesterase domain-containing protein n=1 Tax=Horticoccus luteus TaxID=2862869 RepID=A0A8F9TTR4_9BACT|nr:YiiD C-terminal domain-containing protein [Horticoccus luteus]QYM77937.1 thioesterase domain-containing protein [Horticoccus luteus]